MQGTIKTLKEKGFGFIVPDDDSKEVFFHASDLEGIKFQELSAGMTVEYELKETPKGLAAAHIFIFTT